MVKAVIFDMDGLLIDSERAMLRAFTRTLRSFLLPPMDELYKETIGQKRADAIKTMQSNLQGCLDFGSFISALDNEKSRELEKGVPAKRGAAELLERCRIRQLPIAVATSTVADEAHQRLQKAGLGISRNQIVGGDAVTHGKPHPEIYLKAAAKVGCDTTDCLAFEDSRLGIRSALAARTTAVQVLDLDDAFTGTGSPIVAHDLISAAKLVGLM